MLSYSHILAPNECGTCNNVFVAYKFKVLLYFEMMPIIKDKTMEKVILIVKLWLKLHSVKQMLFKCSGL